MSRKRIVLEAVIEPYEDEEDIAQPELLPDRIVGELTKVGVVDVEKLEVIDVD